ncbi:MAG TPA: hypothetical protein PKZ58_00020 [Bacillota bacterium]|nr:hypothetical protein [Bacillota bacterium]
MKTKKQKQKSRLSLNLDFFIYYSFVGIPKGHGPFGGGFGGQRPRFNLVSPAES